MKTQRGTLDSRDVRTALLLAVIAFLIYLPGIGWGLPYANDPVRTHGWATDSLTPLEPLAQVHGLFAPKSDRYLGYPLMHHFVLLTAYVPYLLYVWLSGGLQSPGGAEFPFGLANPVRALQTLEIIGKVVSMCMAAGIVATAYITAKMLWDRTAGLLAGTFTMLLYPMVYYSRTGNLDVPVLFWTSLGLMAYVRILLLGLTTRRAAFLGVFAAFAIATKDQGWAAFALMPPVLLVLHLRSSNTAGSAISWRPLLIGFLASVTAYLLASGMAISPERHLAHIAWIRAHVPFPESDHLPATLAGNLQLLGRAIGHMSDASGPLMVAASAVGIFVAARQPLHLTLLLPIVGHFFLVLMPVHLSLLRYVMPMSFVGCLFAACGLSTGLAAGSWRRLLSVCTVIGICGWLLLFAADLTYQMLRDSHYAAAAWLDQHTKPGDTVGTVAPTASLPRLKTGIHYLVMIRDNFSTDKIRQNHPEFIIIQPDFTTPKGGIHPRRFPKESYEGLSNGSLGYSLAASFLTKSLIDRQILDYASVNPPIEIYARRQ
jgi:hypothetical protein